MCISEGAPAPADADGAEPPAYPGPAPQKITSVFVRWVEQAARVRYPDATIQRMTADNGTVYFDVNGLRDGEWQRWPVGISADGLDQDTLAAFYEQVVVRYELFVGEPVESELVYGGALAEQGLVGQARRRWIRVRSLAQFEGRWDPRRYLLRQTARLETDPAYPPSLYVPQRSVLADGVAETAAQDDVLAAAVDWLDVEEARFLLVLGDFGHGKTFLLHELARRLPAERPGMIPMLVELRTLEKTHSVADLLSLHLTKTGEHGVDVRTVRRMLERGRIILLLDGFDELALRVTYDRAAEHLRMIMSAVTGRAKVVLTSRTQHFASDDQWRTELGELVRRHTASRQIRLVDFDQRQIREFLVRLFERQIAAEARGAIRNATADATRDTARHTTGNTDANETPTGAPDRPAVPDSQLPGLLAAQQRADARLKLIHGIRDLRELSVNPRMLSFIAELPESDLRAASAPNGTVSAADLYAQLVERWLANEVARRRFQTLTAGQLRQAVDALAVTLWENGEDATDLAGLSDTVRTALTDLGKVKLDATQAAFIVGSGSLLIRREDRFSFVHRSVMEFLAATVAARELDGGPVPYPHLTLPTKRRV